MRQIHLKTVDSTQTYAKANSQSFAQNEITCVFADAQTAGRGRFLRKWISPPDVNIYATFYFILPPKTPQTGSMSQIMAFSFASILLQEGLQPKIKWPNDIQLSGKKIAGVLTETRLGKDLLEFFVGIGINVNAEPETFAQIDQPASSLWAETKRKWDKNSLLHALQKEFSANLEKFKKEGFFPFYAPFDQLLAFKGQEIRCFDGEKIWVGICHSLTADGRLNLLLPDQTLHPFSSGDLS